MLEPKLRIPLHYNNGESLVYGINIGKFPYHHFAGNFARDVIPGLPLKVHFCGHDEWVKGCYRKRICSDVFNIEFVIRGSLMFAQHDDKYRVNEGELFLVQRKQDSEIYADNSRVEKITLSLGGRMLEEILRTTGLNSIDVMKPDNPRLIKRLMDEAFDNIKNQSEGFQVRCSSLAYQLLLELGKEIVDHKYSPLVAESLKLMDDSIDRQMTINDFCDRIGTSPATLNRAFRKYLKMPPMEYFIKIKMDSACRLLRFTNFNIKEIARMTGYSNQLYFSSEFRKRLGVSPKAYRKGEGIVV